MNVVRLSTEQRVFTSLFITICNMKHNLASPYIQSHRNYQNKNIIKAVLTLDVLAEIPAKLTELWRMIGAPVRKATSDLSLFVSYYNQQSWKGFNLNSLYGKGCHQMFMLQIKEQIQIVNGNNFFRMKYIW